MPGHARLRRHARVLRIRMRLLLQVVLVLHGLSLLGRHVAAGHAGCRRHAGSAAGHLVVLVLGRVADVVAVNAVLVGRRLGRVEACLRERVSRDGAGIGVGAMHHARCAMLTWMRFLPSGLVTSGCSLGVVKV